MTKQRAKQNPGLPGEVHQAVDGVCCHAVLFPDDKIVTALRTQLGRPHFREPVAIDAPYDLIGFPPGAHRGFHDAVSFLCGQISKVFPDDGIVAALRRQLSWAHFRELIAIGPGVILPQAVAKLPTTEKVPQPVAQMPAAPIGPQVVAQLTDVVPKWAQAVPQLDYLRSERLSAGSTQRASWREDSSIWAEFKRYVPVGQLCSQCVHNWAGLVFASSSPSTVLSNVDGPQGSSR